MTRCTRSNAEAPGRSAGAVPRRVNLLRQQQRLDRAIALQQHPIGVDGMDPRIARHPLAHRIDLGIGGRRADDGQPVLRIRGGHDAGQDQRHIGRWRVRVIHRRRRRRIAEQVAIAQRGQVQRADGRQRRPRPGHGAAGLRHCRPGG